MFSSLPAETSEEEVRDGKWRHHKSPTYLDIESSDFQRGEDLSQSSQYYNPSTPKSDTATQETNPSPLLLNPLTRNDWVESSSRLKIKSPNSSVKRIINDKIQPLEKGYLLYLLDDRIEPEEMVLLDCQDNQSVLRIFRLPQKKDNHQTRTSDPTDCWHLPIKNIHRLELGSTSSSALSKDFAIVLKEANGELTSYKFEAQSIYQKETVCAGLLEVLSHSKVGAGNKGKLPPSHRVPLPRSQKKSSKLSLARTTEISTRTGELCTKGAASDLIPSDDCVGTGLIFSDDEMEVLDSLVPSVAMPVLDDTRQDEDETFSDSNSIRRSADFNKPVGDERRPLTSSSTEMSAQWFVDNMCMFAFCSDEVDSPGGPVMCTTELEKYGCSVSNWGKQLALQNYYFGMLGSSNMLTELCSGDELWGLKRVDSGTSVDKRGSDESCSMFRNRATVVSGQAIRKNTLLQQMTFNGALEGSRRQMLQLQVTKSMDDADRGELNTARDTVTKNVPAVRSLYQMKAQKDKESWMPLNVPNMFQSLLENSLSEDIHEDLDDTDCCYDSDPEDARVLKSRRGPRWVDADRLNQIENNDAKPSLFSFQGNKNMDEEKVQRVLEEIKSETMHLLWHPTQTSWDPNRPPACVNFWVERGMCLNNNICVQPKLMWSVTHERNLHARELNMSAEGAPDFIELLGINGVLKGQPIDRRAHPFACKQKCFLIETRNQVFLFEAQTVAERDQIVIGLRLLVARLVSMVMVKDQRVVKEYFGSAADEVPGEAPEWAT
mmetsp:Transcript_26362/g.37143  ORF Transcript_26362/g.37143 Transcript_26362/m.37143 type:complete len:774 (+) Transcript_26362:174-2495(+)